MKRMILATHNEHKLQEVKEIIGEKFQVVSLEELGYSDEIPENGLTLQANALKKAKTIHQHFNENCFADDTGLEVEALHGEPGVLSARYAGEHSNSENNIRKLLHELKDKTNREAQFRTVIALIYNDKNYYFEGIVRGIIASHPAGENGFGYDSVFIPEGYNETFAELDAETKNRISHRAKALDKLRKFLAEHYS